MNLSVCNTARTGAVFVLGCLSLLSLAGPGSPAKGSDHLRLMKSTGFTENRGQWDSRALFLTSAPGKNVWLTKDGFVVDLYRMGRTNGTGPDSETVTRTGHVIQFQLDGASLAASAQGATQIPRRIDYLRGGEDSRVFTTTQYKEAYLKGVYQNVDLRSYLDGGSYRYDLIAHPGSDPSRIRFNVRGADRVRLDDKGNLVIQTQLGNLVQSRPVVFQQVGGNRKAVSASFTVTGSQIGFKLGEYNRSLPVVIDPRVYGSYVGADFRISRPDQLLGDGDNDDTTYDGAATANGDLLLTGYTTADNFPVLNGPYGFDYSGFRDAYVVRMDADAYALDYAAFIGGTGRDEALAISLAENAGTFYIGGTTSSVDLPGSVNTDDFLRSGFASSFWFMKFTLSSTGAIAPVSSRYYLLPGQASFAYKRRDYLLNTDFPGTNAFFAGMAATNDGSLFFAGDAGNLSGAYTPFLSNATRGGRDTFVQKFNAADLTEGTRRFIGSRFTDRMGKMTATPDNGIVLTGVVLSNVNQDTANPGSQAVVFPTTAGVFSGGRLLRNNDAFIVKMSNTLGVSWSSLLGGASNDRGVAVTTDPTGAVYVLTKAGSFDFPRTRGVYDAVNASIEDVVTKISANGSTMVYSTGLRHSGNVNGTSIKADYRGVAVVGGTVGFVYPGGTPPQPMVPGSIPVTPDAEDPDYEGGDDSVFPNNTVEPTNLTGFRATYEGFVQVVNATGSDVLYASYVGGEGDEEINNVYIDRVGAAWLLGTTNTAVNNSGQLKDAIGIPVFITSNAFKEVPDAGGEAKDGFAIKLRVQLPILTNITLAQPAIAGGLGASTTGTVTLERPAPAGGVVINLEVSATAATSFSPTGGQPRLSLVVPAGQTTANFTVFSSPVTVVTPSTIRATLDNDFLVTELTVHPWLSELTTTPGVLVGGNQVSLIVRLFQNATQEIRIPITSSSSSLVTPPSNNEIVVPAGAPSASVLLNTGGVEAPTDVQISGSLLGVTIRSTVQLLRAELASLSFNPDRVLSNEPSTLTLTWNGRIGASRTVNLALLSGAAITVNGRALPQTVTVPAQANQLNLPVRAPLVTGTSSATVRATAGAFAASGTLFIDPIDIFEISVNTDNVLGGATITGRVVLTRPAGQSAVNITLANNNATAGTISPTTVTVPAGQIASNDFTFRTNIVGTTQIATLSASAPGFTTRTSQITVRPIRVLIDVDPNSVLGGDASAAVSVSIDTAAPVGGLTVNLESNNAAAILSQASVLIPEGQTTPAVGTNITVATERVATDRVATISGRLSGTSSGSDTLTIRAPRVTGVTAAPSVVTGGSSSLGTVTIEASSPVGGMTVNLTSSNTAVLTVPATAFIPEGETTANFFIGTRTVDTNADVTVTATGSSSQASTVVTVIASNISAIRFNPSIVRGGNGSTGTITLNAPAPSGGMRIRIASDDASKAAPVQTEVTIAAGQRTATFQVTTTRVSRRINIGFTATIVSTGRTGRGFLGLAP